MSRVIAVANQKGGVGKTTTTLSVAAAMSELGQAVLVVDLDPQACLTFSLGYDPDVTEPSLHDMVVGRQTLADTIVRHGEVDLAPANIDLAGAEVTLLSRTGREFLLRGELAELADTYDVILLDCAPSLGVLTINGLTAADEVIIPVQCETLSHRGVSQLLETIHDVRRLTNRTLEVRGMVATMFDPRTRHSREVLRDLVARYDLPLLGAPVRKSVRFAEAPTHGKSLLATGQDVPGASAYRCIARELLGLDPDEDLLAAAGWDPDRRALVLDEVAVVEEPAVDVEEAQTDAVPATTKADEAAGNDSDDDVLTVVDLDAWSRRHG